MSEFKDCDTCINDPSHHGQRESCYFNEEYIEKYYDKADCPNHSEIPEIQKYFCPECFIVDQVEYKKGAGAYEVIQKIGANHRRLHPNCKTQTANLMIHIPDYDPDWDIEDNDG